MLVSPLRLMFLLSVFCSTMAFSQDFSSQEFEKQLKTEFTQLRKAKSDGERTLINDGILTLFEEKLNHIENYYHSFASLQTISTLKSPDGKFRFFNWNIENDDKTFQYFAYILIPRVKKKTARVIKLENHPELIFDIDQQELNETNWLGMLYYKIIPVKKGSKTYYTLLGWDGKDPITTKKTVETMAFRGRKIKFGLPVIKNKKKTSKRFIIEYSDRAKVGLRLENIEKQKFLVFDHLEPELPQLEGFYQYYVPNLSYDGFRLENGKWYFEKEISITNSKKNRKRKKYSPKDDPYNQLKKVSKKYKDPYDPGNPYTKSQTRTIKKKND